MPKTTKFREFDRLDRLKKRVEYIQDRLDRSAGSAGSLQYYTGELSALEWAIPILETYLMNKLARNLEPETLEAVKNQIPEDIYKRIKAGVKA